MSTGTGTGTGNGTGPTRFEVVRQGAREHDDVEIVHYEPQYPPGSKAEKRMTRIVSLMFMLSGLTAILFVLAYVWWPFTDWPSVDGWQYQPGNTASKGFTPILGLMLGLSLGFLGLGILTWGKKLLPHEIALQDRHDGGSDPAERALTGTTLQFIGEELGLARRPLLKVALAAPAAGLGAAALVVPVGMLIKDPHHPDVFFHTGWDPAANGGKKVRLVREDGVTAIRPEDISVGGQITAFPGIPEGNRNKHADSPVLLIRLRQDDAARLRENIKAYPTNAKFEKHPMVGDLVAYSKICTHAGCPASLYEQETNRLLCPCHQSQFLITDNAKPIFGPATQRLPMLPLELDEEGFLAAQGDFAVPVGPAFWEKPSERRDA
ncbi:ubiquinol-cytochrome c reductase iron-sulfur subunit [Allorhizocola rhizosphaerae]|uniref:cytochrome bc1 complex Rieske iron-sulfur subunit n=1 Tax=Allorhizocola rhizosphaerae TaxID=1872709 RepID=UPI000E3EC05B|nr:Rieske 2Fe-2S domain-containing protein [Allorhizocola rhizosphaerae]